LNADAGELGPSCRLGSGSIPLFVEETLDEPPDDGGHAEAVVRGPSPEPRVEARREADQERLLELT
jgi:hypothetical protein